MEQTIIIYIYLIPHKGLQLFIFSMEPDLVFVMREVTCR